MMRKYLVIHRVSLLMGLAVTALVLWLQLSGNAGIREAVNRLDYLAYDLRMRATLQPVDRESLQVILLDIDEARVIPPFLAEAASRP